MLYRLASSIHRSMILRLWRERKSFAPLNRYGTVADVVG